MAVPQEHAAYLRRTGYLPPYQAVFSEEEAAILTRYGYWMEALASGVIAPNTPEQGHFLKVAQGEAAPETPFEQVWAKLRRHPRESTLPGLPAPSHPASPAIDDQADYKETLTKFEQLAMARTDLEEIRGRVETEREEILKKVRAELEALEVKYAQQLQEASREVAELESEVKAGVLKLGRSLRIADVHAVFYRGRVTWDSQGLASYAQANPEVEQFRKVGEPRVVVRYQ